MLAYELNKEICLLNGIKLLIELHIPLERKLTSVEEDNYMNEILIKQITMGFRKAIKDYEESVLLDKFLYGSPYQVSNNLGDEEYGMYDTEKNIITFDADTISGLFDDNSYTLAHEVGHRIFQHKGNEEIMEEIANIAEVSTKDERLIKELYANECGNIATKSFDDYIISLTKQKHQALQRKILANIYHV